METQTAENAATPEAAVETPVSTVKKSRFAASTAFLKNTPKWALITVPALAVALGGYAYMQKNKHGENGTAVAAMQAPTDGPQGPFGQPMPNGVQQPTAPVAYGPAYAPVGPYYGPHYGPAYGHDGYAYGDGRGYGRGYGHGNGHGNGHGHGHGRMNTSFSFGGNVDGGGDVDGRGNGYGAGDGYGNGNGNGYGNSYGRNGW